jgi:hypothetical protein
LCQPTRYAAGHLADTHRFADARTLQTGEGGAGNRHINHIGLNDDAVFELQFARPLPGFRGAARSSSRPKRSILKRQVIASASRSRFSWLLVLKRTANPARARPNHFALHAADAVKQ